MGNALLKSLFATMKIYEQEMNEKVQWLQKESLFVVKLTQHSVTQLAELQPVWFTGHYSFIIGTAGYF